VLAVLAEIYQGSGADSESLFTWLRTLTFITYQSGRCQFHDVIRSLILHHVRGHSPAHWGEAHLALAEHYSRLGVDLEKHYHLLCAGSSGALASAAEDMVHGCVSDVAEARRWTQMIVDAGRDAGSAEAARLGERLERSLEATAGAAVIAYMAVLIESGLLSNSALVTASHTVHRFRVG